MVLLSVKGTTHTDEFTYETDVSAKCGDIAKTVAHIQNMRHKVRNQLLSIIDLVPSAKKAVEMDNRPPEDAAIPVRLQELCDQLLAQMKQPRVPVGDAEYDRYWEELRDLVVRAFPNECAHADGQEAAITHLYEMHENPDIDEDYRLFIYHCRTVLDPMWRVHERLDEEKALALWFSGRAMPVEETIGSLCKNNNKSRITVKVTMADGSAPAMEPRISYEDQRALRQEYLRRAEERKGLEESELRSLVERQSRPQVIVGTPSSSSIGASNIDKAGIAGRRTETVVSGAD